MGLVVTGLVVVGLGVTCGVVGGRCTEIAIDGFSESPCGWVILGFEAI